MVRKYRSIALPASCLFILQIGCTDLLYFRSIFFTIKWKCIVIKATHTFIVVIQSIHRSNHTGSATDWYYIFESTLRIRSTPVGLPDFVSPPDLILGKCVYLIWLCTTQLHIISNFISSLTETCLLLLNLFQLVRTFVNKKVTAGKRLEISILAQSVSPWAFKVW